MEEITKDFYDKLPSMVCEMLDNVIISKYSGEIWFNEYWNKYKQHVLETDMFNVLMPSVLLKQYIKEEK